MRCRRGDEKVAAVPRRASSLFERADHGTRAEIFAAFDAARFDEFQDVNRASAVLFKGLTGKGDGL